MLEFNQHKQFQSNKKKLEILMKLFTNYRCNPQHYRHIRGIKRAANNQTEMKS